MGLTPKMFLTNIFTQDGCRLVYHYDFETVWIEPWGTDSFRVRATVRCAMEDEKNWALLSAPEGRTADIAISDDGACITNGNLTAKLENSGRLSFWRGEKLLLCEFLRNRKDTDAEYCSALDIDAREFKANMGSDDFRVTARFESDPNEKLYGMGQYQQPYLNIKGCELELAHRNSQASVPFVVSSLGYGFLWNNPAVGSVTFGRNVTARTSSIAENANAVLAINGDYYGARQSGYVIRNGVIYRSKANRNAEDLVIYQDGSFGIINESEISAQALLDNGAWNVLSFGPALLIDGEIAVSSGEEVGRAMASNPRTAIGIVDDLHYLFVVSDGRTNASEGLSLRELAQVLEELGAKTAYNLDGGGSSTMVFQGQVVNNPTSNGKRITERSVSDIVCITC